LKEEYKRDRHVKQISHSTSAALRNSLLNNGNPSGDEQSLFLFSISRVKNKKCRFVCRRSLFNDV